MTIRNRRSKLDIYIDLIRVLRNKDFSLKDIKIKLKLKKIIVVESTIARFCEKNKIKRRNTTSRASQLDFRTIVNSSKNLNTPHLSRQTCGFKAAKSKLYPYVKSIKQYRRAGKSHENIAELLTNQIRVHRSTISRFCQAMGI